MRPLLVNSEDLRGGAARAVYRLHRALRAEQVDSRMLVQVKHGEDEAVVRTGSRLRARIRAAADLLPLLRYPRRGGDTFYPGWLAGDFSRHIEALAPDVVHLHWIAGGFLNLAALENLRRPLLWTLHDMWPFTGGCHYDGGCARYAVGCGRCPVLGSQSLRDLSARGWARKQNAYRRLQLHIVAPSRWLAGLARASPLLARFPVAVIPNAIDTAVFKPSDKRAARDLLQLPIDEDIVLFGALRATSERRKGFHLLQEALKAYGQQKGRKLRAVVFGVDPAERVPELGIPCSNLGTFRDEAKLARLYAAADVFVAPSTQENLSNTVMEALSCGTPVVAFSIGGMPDMIEHMRNGYLAEPFLAEDLAQGIGWVLEEEGRHAALCARAREKVLEEYESRKVAHRYLALYEQVVELNKLESRWAR
jgi:glycosyltransferase involved in cell wall biosynthesis